MNEPRIWVLQDGTYPTYVVVREDDEPRALGEPPLAHLLAWRHTFGHAEEYVRDWHIERERAQANKREHTRGQAADAASW